MSHKHTQTEAEVTMSHKHTQTEAEVSWADEKRLFEE